MGLVLTDEMRDSIRSQLVAKPESRKNPKRNTYRFNHGRVYKSDALGVAPEQVEEYRELLHQHGVTAEVFPDGRVGIASEKQWKEVARAGGLWNGKDGFAAYDQDGNRIMTGREQGKAQAEIREKLRNEARGYPSNFPRHLQRRAL